MNPVKSGAAADESGALAPLSLPRNTLLKHENGSSHLDSIPIFSLVSSDLKIYD